MCNINKFPNDTTNCMDYTHYAAAYRNSNCNLISFSIIPGDANTLLRTREAFTFHPTPLNPSELRQISIKLSLSLSQNTYSLSLSRSLPFSFHQPWLIKNLFSKKMTRWKNKSRKIWMAKPARDWFVNMVKFTIERYQSFLISSHR